MTTGGGPYPQPPNPTPTKTRVPANIEPVTSSKSNASLYFITFLRTAPVFLIPGRCLLHVEHLTFQTSIRNKINSFRAVLSMRGRLVCTDVVFFSHMCFSC
jgi:hypothetical protein